MYLYGSAHHVDDILRDGHAQSSTLNLADGGSTLPLKGLEYFFGKFLAHADTGVLHTNFIFSPALRCPGKLSYPDRNRTAGGGKLNGIGQQIQQHLIQPGLVAEYILVGHIHHIHIQLQLLGVNLTADDGFDVMQDIRQVGLRFLQIDFSALDPAHVQHIVNQAKQVLAGRQNFGQVVFHFLPVVNVGYRQRRETDDCVHRRADIMGHVGKEGALCFIRFLRHMEGLLRQMPGIFQGGVILPKLFVELFQLPVLGICPLLRLIHNDENRK